MKSKTFTRWIKFNAAGLLGVGVQIATLAALTRFAGFNYLAATAFAVETAVLHNFIWHERYTWADRTRATPQLAWKRLLHFNLSNGSVSLVGNLALMKLLVDYAKLPALLANVIAIACCSTVNFLVGEFLVFSSEARETQAPESNDQLFI
jgi:putative flippase GtrA